MIDYETYELNRMARKIHPCVNPRCDNFVEMQNSYGLCISCFMMLVEHLGSAHKIFDYSTKPALRRMTRSELKLELRRAGSKIPSLKYRKIGSPNSQERGDDHE